jgi:UbiD family decarboxylase
VAERPVARITAITMCEDPLYYGISSQMPPSESTLLQSLTNAGVVYQRLRDELGEASVSDVYIDLTRGGSLAHAIVSMSPQYRGHGKKVGRHVSESFHLKRVTVVDDDVDIRDALHVDWAMNARFDPATDTDIIENVRDPMDSAVRPADGPAQPGSRLILDATRKIDAGPFSLPPRETMMRALEVWHALGLPEFTIPKRAQLRIDRS